MTKKALMKVRGRIRKEFFSLKRMKWIVNYYMAYIDYSIATSAKGGERSG